MRGSLFRVVSGRNRPLVSLLAVAIMLLVAGWPSRGHAQGKRPKSYYFLVSDVQLAAGIPAELMELVRERLIAAVEAHERLTGALPSDAPDPRTAPDAFAAYVKKHKIEPFRVNIEVTDYSQAVEPSPQGGKRLKVSIGLRTFGETMPKRVMAFSGEGSATIRMDVGKQVRPRDAEAANREATTLAVAEALTTSITRLDAAAKKARATKKK